MKMVAKIGVTPLIAKGFQGLLQASEAKGELEWIVPLEPHEESTLVTL